MVLSRRSPSPTWVFLHRNTHIKGGKIDTGIPWTTLAFCDEEDASQAAARIVGEATED
jgi:hypothetical protein